jgi:outer membrane receptor protein involved in Fe transport
LYNGGFSPSYFLLNSNFAFRPKFGEKLKRLNGLQVAFRMYNLLNEFYQHPVRPDLIRSGMMPQNGRNWQAQLTYLF